MKKMGTLRAEAETHPLKRMVSVVIPANEPQCLLGLESDFAVDSCTLYRVRKFPVMEMLRKEFAEAFIKRGTLYAVSSNASIQSEDCATITPAGELIMSLHYQAVQKLQGNFNISVRSRNGLKSVIKIDLKSSDARKQLKEATLTFDMTLRWIPPDNKHFTNNEGGTVRASSIAKYLRNICNLDVEDVVAGCNKVLRYDEPIPMMDVNNLSSDDTGQTSCTNDDLLEYIGMLALDCVTMPIECVSSYMVDEPQQRTDTVSVFHREGLITSEEIDRAVVRLAKLVDECRTIPWVGLHVQGFPNVPLDFVNHGRSGVDWNYDSAYTMIAMAMQTYKTSPPPRLHFKPDYNAKKEWPRQNKEIENKYH
uniref:Uncharacterized protein n=1 Tax=Anopheles culicifacies TaxID=139723 RepID=A0A182MVH4_9DIPT